MLLCCSLITPHAGVAGERFVYDDLDRLIEAVDESGTRTTYTYDAAGNILSVQSSVSPVQPPSITSIAPASGSLGTAVSITIAGTNLSGATLATDNSGIALSGVTVTTTTVKAVLNIGNGARLGATLITLTTLGGSVTTSFTVAANTPSLASLDPPTGPVTRIVRINGQNFATNAADNQVSFNGTPATVLSASPTQIRTQVPTGAASGNVVVTSYGLASNPLPFTVETAGPPPTVTGISPNIGSIQGGVLVTLTGSNFVPGTTVSVGGKPLGSLTLQDSTTITGLVPAAFATGPVDVIVSNANGDALAVNAFTYLAGGRHDIAQIDPAPGAMSPLNARLTIQFTRSLDRTTVNASTLAVTGSGAAVAGSFAFSQTDTVVTFVPAANLAPNTTYSFAVSQAVKSIDGIPLM